jgi:hypothetical protein
MDRRAFLGGLTSFSLRGQPAGGTPASEQMPEDIRAWYECNLDGYECIAQVVGVWAVFVSEERPPGPDKGAILTVSHWDGLSFEPPVGAPAFRSIRILPVSEYLDVEVDATVPHKFGVTNASPTLLGPRPLAGASYETMSFNLVLGAPSTLTVHVQRQPTARTVVLALRPSREE